MKKLFIAFLLLTSFACTNEPEVKPNLPKGYRMATPEEQKTIFNSVDPPLCLDGSPAGQCCVMAGGVYICVPK